MILRKIIVFFFDVSLSASGIIAASTLMIYGLGLSRYIAGDSGPTILIFWAISIFEIAWMVLAKIISLLWPDFFRDKLGIWFLPSMSMSFVRGFVFSVLYVILWVLNEYVAGYTGIKQSSSEVVFILLPILSLSVICFLEKSLGERYGVGKDN